MQFAPVRLPCWNVVQMEQVLGALRRRCATVTPIDLACADGGRRALPGHAQDPEMQLAAVCARVRPHWRLVVVQQVLQALRRRHAVPDAHSRESDCGYLRRNVGCAPLQHTAVQLQGECVVAAFHVHSQLADGVAPCAACADERRPLVRCAAHVQVLRSTQAAAARVPRVGVVGVVGVHEAMRHRTPVAHAHNRQSRRRRFVPDSDQGGSRVQHARVRLSVERLERVDQVFGAVRRPADGQALGAACAHARRPRVRLTRQISVVWWSLPGRVRCLGVVFVVCLLQAVRWRRSEAHAHRLEPD